MVSAANLIARGGARIPGIITKRGATIITGSSTATLTPNYNQVPAAGNLLTMGVTYYADVNNQTISTPSGWNAGPNGYGHHQYGPNTRVALFWKLATGGDAAPVITVSAAGQTSAVIEEWVNSLGWPASPLESITAPTIDLRPSQQTTSPCNPGASNVIVPKGFIWCFFGAIGDGGVFSVTWGGGTVQSSKNDYSNNRTSSAFETSASTGWHYPTLSVSYGQNMFVGISGSMTFIE